MMRDFFLVGFCFLVTAGATYTILSWRTLLRTAKTPRSEAIPRAEIINMQDMAPGLIMWNGKVITVLDEVRMEVISGSCTVKVSAFVDGEEVLQFENGREFHLLTTDTLTLKTTARLHLK